MSSQPSKTSNSDTNSEQGNDTHTARFFIQEESETHRVNPLPPVRAKDYADRRTQEGSAGARRYNKMKYRTDVTAYDAMIAGWVLFSPLTFRVDEVDSQTYELTVPDEPENAGLITLTELNGKDVVSVNTLWGVSLPEGFSGLLTEPLVNHGMRAETVPQQILPEEREHMVEVLLPVEGEFMIARGDAIGQLNAIQNPIPSASVRTATEDEEQAIRKEQRRRRIYPNAYVNDREMPRVGELNHQ